MSQSSEIVTANAHGRPIITVLAGLAEFERELIRSRCGEGITRAKAWREVWSPAEADAASAARGTCTQSDIARSYNVDATTIGRLAI